MRIRVLTSCTGEQKHTPANQLTLADLRQGVEHTRLREAKLKDQLKPVGEICTGEQHVRLMRGVAAARKAGMECTVHILSAGYGLIPEDRPVAPHECTFASMNLRELQEWARYLRVPQGFREAMAEPYDIGLVLLDGNGLEACSLDEGVRLGGPTLLLADAGRARKFTRIPNLRVVPVPNLVAKRFPCGLAGLKGEVAARLLDRFTDDAEFALRAMDPGFALLDALAAGGRQAAQVARAPVATPEGSQPRRRMVSFTPRANASMLYFIPEWDDRVDPDYDFLRDRATHARNPYEHDVYAHEIYDTPSYDGLLVSKSVIEENKTKKELIARIGIHAHVRVPRNFPIMGDCGAFNYVTDAEPPYHTPEIVRYYQALDFDLGVSIDHLIVPAVLRKQCALFVALDGTERVLCPAEVDALRRDAGTRVISARPRRNELLRAEPVIYLWDEADLSEGKRRWELTLRNSRDFIELHRKLGCSFIPVAGCQGWDLNSQVEMFRLQQEMGYHYIALGGLVRSPTTEILEVLDAVNRLRKPGVKIHLFGVARPDAIEDFVRAGVNSVDSARFLRQAWLSATANYFAGDHGAYLRWLRTRKGELQAISGEEEVSDPRWFYTAVRIPPTVREGGEALTAKARKLVEQGFDVEELKSREARALQSVHAYARDEVELDAALDTIMEYDVLLGGDPRNRERYGRTLTDRPWDRCPCRICQRVGIDTAIFRRNNRNRRRGFHNTWWFFQLFKMITETSLPDDR